MDKIRSVISVIGVLFLYYVGAVLLMSAGLDSLTATVVLNIIVTVFVVLWRKSIREHRTAPCDIKGGFGTLLCVFLLMFVLGQLTGTMVEKLFGPGAFGRYQTTMQANPSVALLLSLVVAPIAEECLLRGFIYQQLRQSWSFWTAWIVQAVIFAWMHGTLVHAVPTFLTALFLALVYEQTGDLRWSIGFHMVYNLLALFVGGMIVPDILYAPWVIVSLDIICVAVMAVIYADIIGRKFVLEVVHETEPLGVAQLAVRSAEKSDDELHDED
jgi:membrane protease YdiL (CAAX protease family)